MVFCSTPLLPGRKSSALPGKPPSRKPLSFQLLCALWLSDRLQGHQIARVQSFAQTKPLCCQYFPEQEKSLALCTAQTRGALPHASAAKTYEIRNAATEFCGANSIAPISTTCPAPRNNSYPIKATPALYVFVLQCLHPRKGVFCDGRVESMLVLRHCAHPSTARPSHNEHNR